MATPYRKINAKYLCKTVRNLASGRRAFEGKCKKMILDRAGKIYDMKMTPAHDIRTPEAYAAPCAWLAVKKAPHRPV
jgi:hypothetical protein